MDTDYPLLRALLMGAVVAVLLPGAPMPWTRLRSELFARYGLDWELGVPPGGGPPGGTPSSRSPADREVRGGPDQSK